MAVSPANTGSVATTSPGGEKSYHAALSVVTTLFFIWGSLTSLNDVLIPYAQHAFTLSLAESMLIQTAFFAAYFVFSLPASWIITWIGYKKAIIVGLLTMVAACLSFYPAARIPSFPFFLTGLIILATGITILQVAANPYVAVLGPPRTASSRLNLTQAFNSLGTTVFPWVGAHLILHSASGVIARSVSEQSEAIVKLYVYFFTAVLILLAFGIGVFKLPTIESAQRHVGEKVNDSVWKHPNVVYGAIGIFVYVGAEVAIGSSIANYLALENIGHMVSSATVADPAERYRAALGVAAGFIWIYWLGAMIGRFIGSALLQKIQAGKLLAIAAVMAALLVTVSVFSSGSIAMWSILAVGLFNSIMFPCIFTMGIDELGPLTNAGSAMLNMAIVGGAVIPWVVGKIGDVVNHRYYPETFEGATSWGHGIQYALILAAVCYVYILFFAVSGSKPNSQRQAKA